MMMMKSICAAVVLFAALAVTAEPPPRYSEWPEGPVKHLMTEAERSAWQKVTTDQEAERFIALFWARRDPTGGTPQNEFKEEFDKRVALADEHFTTKRTRGAMTDRGRVMILLGSPWQVGSRGPAARAPRNPSFTSPWDGGVRGPRGEPAKLTWTYAHDKKPKFIKRKEFEFIFVDDQGDGQYALAQTERDNPEAILLEAKNALIFAPDLTEPPSYAVPAQTLETSLSPQRIQNLKSLTDQFRAEGIASEGPAVLTWSEFVTPGGEVFVPVQLFIPAGAEVKPEQKVTFFGLVENAAGEIVEAYEDEMFVVASGRDAYVDKSLLLPPGEYKGTFGLSDRGKILSIATADLTVNPLDPKAPAMSDMIISNRAYPLEKPQELTDPFAFGGLKVVPKGDRRFVRSDDIWYVFELRNPGIGDSGAPKVQVKIDITGETKEGKPVKMNFPLQQFETIPLKGVDGHHLLALTFPLSDFKPGKYKAKIKVIDTILKKSYESAKEFEIGT